MYQALLLQGRAGELLRGDTVLPGPLSQEQLFAAGSSPTGRALAWRKMALLYGFVEEFLGFFLTGGRGVFVHPLDRTCRIRSGRKNPLRERSFFCAPSFRFEGSLADIGGMSWQARGLARAVGRNTTGSRTARASSREGGEQVAAKVGHSAGHPWSSDKVGQASSLAPKLKQLNSQSRPEFSGNRASSVCAPRTMGDGSR